MQSQSSSSIQDDAGRAFGTAIGNLFVGFFGMAWFVLGVRADGKSHPLSLTVLSCFLAILAAASVYTMRQAHGSLNRTEAHGAAQKKINRQFGLVNFLQWGLIFAAVYGLPHLGLRDWIVPAIVLIVGVHFFPLARLFKAPMHYLTGSIIVVWAIVYPLLFHAGKGDPIGAVGMGAILWASAAVACWRALRLLRRMKTVAADADALPNGAHA